MCGIAGIVSNDKEFLSREALNKMAHSLAHRGPDGQQIWINEENRVGMAHRRLSIIDLTPQASQPMHYLERYTITFNGEIYNYTELKKKLEEKSYTFHTQSDTEVLLALYAEYKESCLEHLDGMYAFAIFDKEEKKLFCARDRFGEKPFYFFYEKGKHFVFASEMKAIWSLSIPKQMDDTMQFNFLAYGFLHEPGNPKRTFYKNIWSLPHSFYITIQTDTIEIIKQKQYFEIHNHVSAAENEQDIIEQFSYLFRQSINRRMRSDVEVGTSLSGGLDSSSVAALVSLALPESSEGLHTFSAVFPGYKKDESRFIESFSGKFRTFPHFVTPSKTDFEIEKDHFLFHQEEPVVDESPYILYKVYELSRKNNIKVLLDGQGADEALAGYHHYYFTYLKELKNTKNRTWHNENTLFRKLSSEGYINDYAFFKRQEQWNRLVGEKMSSLRIWKQKIEQLRSQKIDRTLYRKEINNSFRRRFGFHSLNAHLEYDLFQGKLQTLLRYADRSSMAHGVEIRLPFLEKDLIQFLFSLPSNFKIRNGLTKWILRQCMSSILPVDIVGRKDKVGAEGELR